MAQGRYSIGGLVRKAGHSLRVSVSLTDAESGATLWAENYDGTAGDDFFALQDSIASRVVATIGDQTGVLVRAIAASIAEKPLDELTIAEIIVRYHIYTESFHPEAHARLREAFERRLEREPRAADGWACLAMLYEQEHGFRFNPLPDAPGPPASCRRRVPSSSIRAASRRGSRWPASMDSPAIEKR